MLDSEREGWCISSNQVLTPLHPLFLLLAVCCFQGDRTTARFYMLGSHAGVSTLDRRSRKGECLEPSSVYRRFSGESDYTPRAAKHVGITYLDVVADT